MLPFVIAKLISLRVNPLIFSLIVTVTFSKAFAATVESNEDFLLEDLLQELEQVTAIATRTKLNIDYVPGMVTVLHGRDLEKQGIHTFTEALQTVPGVEITVSDEGQSNYVMRGIGKSFSSGKIKMLINGRAMNAALTAASTISVIPLSLVERIEVIRGPGSAVYGEYAYAGVVNVVLRKDSQLFYGGSFHNKHTVGLSWSNYESDNSLKYLFNFSAHNNEGKQVNMGDDYLKATNHPLFSPISNSPGKSNEAERIFTSALQVTYKDTHWDSFFAHQHVGDYFGYQNALPPVVEPLRKVITASSDLDQGFKISQGFSGQASIGARYYALRGELHHFLPDNFPDITSADPNTMIPTKYFTEGVLGSPNYTEYEAHGSFELNYTNIKNHDLLFGVHGVVIEQGDTWARRNQEFVDHDLDPNTAPVIRIVPLQNYRGVDNWLTENNRRKIASVYAQDQWQITDPLTLTIGGRYDSYFSEGNSFNPRLATVYNLNDQHIFKFQLSRAFRPPTFFELYARNNIITQGNENIEPETIQSAELGYIFNGAGSNTVLRTTVFYTQMDDLITNNETTGVFENVDSVVSRGGEVELVQKVGPELKFSFNGTYVDAKNKTTDTKLTNIANIFGYSKLTYQATPRMVWVLSDQFVGKRGRDTGDPRSQLKGSHIFNLTLTVSEFYARNVFLNLGIKNLANDKARHPSPLISFNGIDMPSYLDDYPRPGREIWLKVTLDY